MNIEIRKSAIKDLRRISEPHKSHIHGKIMELKNFQMYKMSKNSQILSLHIDIGLGTIGYCLMSLTTRL